MSLVSCVESGLLISEHLLHLRHLRRVSRVLANVVADLDGGMTSGGVELDNDVQRC